MRVCSRTPSGACLAAMPPYPPQGLRPLALRPTLSDELPFSGFDALRSHLVRHCAVRYHAERRWVGRNSRTRRRAMKRNKGLSRWLTWHVSLRGDGRSAQGQNRHLKEGIADESDHHRRSTDAALEYAAGTQGSLIACCCVACGVSRPRQGGYGPLQTSGAIFREAYLRHPCRLVCQR